MTTQDPKSVAIDKYFRPTPAKPNNVGLIVLLVLCGLLMLVGLTSRDGGVCITIPSGLVAVFLAYTIYNAGSVYSAAYKIAEPKPSDAQIDSWFSEDRQRIVGEALGKLGFVPETTLNAHEPLVIVGPKRSARVKKGADGVYRFSAYEIVTVFLTNYHLGAYTCALDFVNSRTLTEQTQEYHYADVVSVATQNTNSPFSLTMPNGKDVPISSSQEFALAVSSGDRISVTVAFPQMDNDLLLRDGKLAPTGSDKAIATIRNMLREKKGTTVAH